MPESQVGVEIVERIADREGVDAVDLDVRLNDVIDADALEALINGNGDRQPRTKLRVTFSYSGYAVTVDRGGTITIDEQPTERNERVRMVPTDDSRADDSAERAHRDSVPL